MHSGMRSRRRTSRTEGTACLVFCVLAVLCGEPAAGAGRTAGQEPPGPEAVPARQLRAAIDRLGDLDYATRTAAARTIRRTAGVQAVPALIQAVGEHTDGYVRYRALVLLTGFNDPRTADVMRQSRSSPNDRLRATAYGFFEHHPDTAMTADLLAALDKEQGEFVRPGLVRALAAAVGSTSRADDRVPQALIREIGRGEDYFRSTVIEALGDYKAQYAFDAIADVARLDGPLQDDAAMALGKIGDPRALATLAALQRTVPRQTQPALEAAICLLGVNCASHEKFLIETLTFAGRTAGFQDLLRGAAAGLAALAVAGGHEGAVDALIDAGRPSRESTRAPVSLALGVVALRRTPLMLSVLARRPDRARAIDLVAEGFDMLEEDLEKETFFAAVRKRYWEAAEGSPERDLMQALIGKLDF